MSKSKKVFHYSNSLATDPTTCVLKDMNISFAVFAGEGGSKLIYHPVYYSIPQSKIAVTIIHRRQYLKLFPAANILVT